MNILQINTTDTRGGTAKVAYSIKQELEKRGHQTSMFVGQKYSSDPHVHILNNKKSFLGKVRTKMAYWLANDIDVFSSNHILKMEEFKNADIVHCHNLHTNYFNLDTLIKISALKPIVWTFHDMWPITAHCAHSFDGELKKDGFFTCPSLDIYPPIAWHNEKYLEGKKTNIYSNSNFHIVTPSKWLADKVSQSVLKDKPLSIIYNGIDAEIFRPLPKVECRKELNLPQSKKIVLVVAKRGQSNPWKGGSYSQEIFKRFAGDREIFFVDLGGDIDENNEKIRTVSYISDQTMLAKYYSSADFLLYPSVADNCPLVVLEAQACGLPIITFNTGGIPELVDHQKTGYIARYKDIGDLTAGVQWLTSRSFSEHAAMSKSATSKIRSGFTLEQMIDQYLNLYKKRD